MWSERVKESIVVAALFAAVIALPLAAQPAQAPAPAKPEPQAQSLWSSEGLTGNWGGARTDMKTSTDSWIIGPVLKVVAAFEESVKKFPLIPMGTPDPFSPARDGSKKGDRR